MIIIGKVKITDTQYKKAEITNIDANTKYDINFAKHKAFDGDIIKYDIDNDIIIEVIKMKSFVTNKGTKLTKTAKFKIKKVLEKDKERVFEIIL